MASNNSIIVSSTVDFVGFGVFVCLFDCFGFFVLFLYFITCFKIKDLI